MSVLLGIIALFRIVSFVTDYGEMLPRGLMGSQNAGANFVTLTWLRYNHEAVVKRYICPTRAAFIRDSVDFDLSEIAR